MELPTNFISPEDEREFILELMGACSCVLREILMHFNEEKRGYSLSVTISKNSLCLSIERLGYFFRFIFGRATT